MLHQQDNKSSHAIHEVEQLTLALTALTSEVQRLGSVSNPPSVVDALRLANEGIEDFKARLKSIEDANLRNIPIGNAVMNAAATSFESYLKHGAILESLRATVDIVKWILGAIL
jgi:hypothetical protein